jgi:hypothetical protein
VELSATAGVHGAVSPSGTVYVARGAHQPFTATPDAYYHTDQILTNGAAAVTNLGSGASVYVWSNVTVAGVLRAHFGENLAPQGTPEWWLALYGLTNSGLTFTEAETNDVDHDGHTAGQERVADTDPTNAASRFRVVAISNLPPLRVFFGTSTSRVYELEWRGDLATSGWAVVGDQTNRAGSGGTLSLSDTNAPSPRRFYRVGVGY